MKISKNQIIKIHIAKKQLNLSEEVYKNFLSSFGVSTSKDLAYEEGDKLLYKFITMGWKPKYKNASEINKLNWGKNNYEFLNNRSEEYATPKQLRMIEAIWRNISKDNTNENLNKFIKRIVGIDNIQWLLRNDVRKVVKGLQIVSKNKKYKNFKQVAVH